MTTFSVRSVLEWKGRKELKKKHLYEERITIWNANSLNEAIAFAEKEEKEYINSECSRKEMMEPLGFYQGFWSFDEVELTKQGSEIFSLLRESDLDPDAYLDTFFDTGMEHQTQKKAEPGGGINSEAAPLHDTP